MTSEPIVCSIPEDMLVNMQLEAIFTPKLRQQREKTYNIVAEEDITNKHAKFVHYTTAEAAMEIISKKRLWLRQTSCMSDYSEVEHGFELLRKYFSNDNNIKGFSNIIDKCAPGAVQEAIDMFNKHFDSVRSSTYIASISEHDSEENDHGRLSMWRAFGGATGRVALVLKVPWYEKQLVDAVKQLQIRFSPVAYVPEKDYDKEFKAIMANISSNIEFLCSVGKERIVLSIFNMLLMNTISFKHCGFREEREWRIMYLPLLWPSALMEPETKVINGVPQQIYKLPLDSSKGDNLTSLDISKLFDRLIIGPTEYSWPMFQAFSNILTSIGVEDAHQRVFCSRIPVRK